MANQNIINVFNKLIAEKQEVINDLKKDKVTNKKEITAINFKIVNFRKGLKAIKEFPKKIEKGEDLKDIKGVGKGIISRINEIISEGTLKGEIKNNKERSNKLTKIEELQRITGVGPAKARALVDLKIDLKRLREAFENEEEDILKNLTHHQIIGLRYLEDFEARIPRQEIIQLRVKMKKIMSKFDPELEIIVCGSFRREKAESGDIDVLFLNKKFMKEEEILENDENYLMKMVNHLKSKKVIVDSLTDGGKTKYMGVCKLTQKYIGRRIDIRLIPYESKGAAMLYFTGSGNFNKVMRTHALKEGYTINEYGVYSLKKEGKKMVKDELIPTNDEKDIFKVVKMEYLEPKDRK